MGLKENTGVYRGLHGDTRAYRGLPEYTRDCGTRELTLKCKL